MNETLRPMTETPDDFPVLLVWEDGGTTTADTMKEWLTEEARFEYMVGWQPLTVLPPAAPTGSHASAVAEPATEGADASVDKAFEDLWFSEPFFSGIGVPLSAKEIARQRFRIAVASITAREASMRERLKEALSELEKRDELDRFSVSQNEMLTARLKEAEAKLAEPGIAEYVALKERVNKAEKLAEEWKRSDNLHTQTLHEVGDILSGRKNNGYLGGDVKSLARVLRTEFDELKADKEQAVARERERSEAAGFQRAVDKIREIRSASTSAAWFRDDVTSWLNSLTQPANRSAEEIPNA